MGPYAQPVLCHALNAASARGSYWTREVTVMALRDEADIAVAREQAAP
jgi:hypothetical protein